MSWPLFCHNAGVLGVAPVVVPPDGTELDAELINTGVVGAGPESVLACYGTKILFNKGNGQWVFSSDGGTTWADKGTYNWAGGERVMKVEVDPATGAWYFESRTAATSKIARSMDDGMTWTQMTMPFNRTTNTTLGMMVDYLGRLVFVSERVAASGIQMYRWSDPTNTLAHDETFVVTTSGHNVDNIKELDGYGYAISRWTGTIQNVNLVPYSMDSTQYIQPLSLHGTSEDNLPWTFSLNGEVLVWESSTSGNPRFIKIYNGMTATKEYLTLDFAASSEMHRINCSPTYWLAVSQPIGVASRWKLRISEGDLSSFGGEITLNLPSDPYGSDAGLNCFNVYHVGGTLWVGYYFNTPDVVTLIRWNIGSEATAPPSEEVEVVGAQGPDIFLKLDETGSPASVIDLGTKRYQNYTSGSLLFAQTGLVDDGGTAMKITSATNSGIRIGGPSSNNAVITPWAHAHVFVLKHDGTAALRVLACSGRWGITDEFTYAIVLGADHRLGVATWNSLTEAFVYHWSPDPIATDATTVCAVLMQVRNQDSTHASMYIGPARVAKHVGINAGSLANQPLMIGGGYLNSVTSTNCAVGVTLDYYMLIPEQYFDYAALWEALGTGDYVPPPQDNITDYGKVVFLAHFDDTPVGPFSGINGNFWKMINSAGSKLYPLPNNDIRTGAIPRITTATKKFGAASAIVPYRASTADPYPWDVAYFSEQATGREWDGPQIFEVGYSDFSYDAWVKPEWENGFFYALSNQTLTYQGGVPYPYGGMTISVSHNADATKGNISIEVGTSLGQAVRTGKRNDLVLNYTNIPGWVEGSFNHIAVSRRYLAASGGTYLWNVFLNGVKAGEPSVIETIAGSYRSGVYIRSGGPWLFGSYMMVNSVLTQQEILIDRATGQPYTGERFLSLGAPPPYIISYTTTSVKKGVRYSPPGLIDEPRLVIRHAVFTETFAVPTAPYNYG